MPKRPEPLDIWLYGHRLATLTQPRLERVHYRLDFTAEALDRYGGYLLPTTKTRGKVRPPETYAGPIHGSRLSSSGGNAGRP